MKRNLYFFVIVSIIASSMLIPSYAEVTSFNTDSQFYKGGSSITFSGTILSTDPHAVTIVIFDPNNKFVTLTSAMADSSNSFQTVFDTSTTANKNLLTLKGVYNATAFVTNQTSGKTVIFVFSPDGSSVVASPPTNLTATASSSSEIDLNWLVPQNTNGLPITGYQIERNDGNGFNVVTNSQTISYQDIGLIPNSEHSYRVSAINMGGTSNPSNIALLFTLNATTTSMPSSATSDSSSNSSATPSLEELLKQRMDEAQRLQALLNGQNSDGSSNTLSTTSSSSSGTPQSVNLTENVGLGDQSENLGSQKNHQPQNNPQSNTSANFDIKNILYIVISLIGVGIVVTILYLQKKRKLVDNTNKTKTALSPVVSQLDEQHDDYDHAMSILKNRLAKGEITIDEFKTLKDELSEP